MEVEIIIFSFSCQSQSELITLSDKLALTKTTLGRNWNVALRRPPRTFLWRLWRFYDVILRINMCHIVPYKNHLFSSCQTQKIWLPNCSIRWILWVIQCDQMLELNVAQYFTKVAQKCNYLILNWYERAQKKRIKLFQKLPKTLENRLLLGGEISPNLVTLTWA